MAFNITSDQEVPVSVEFEDDHGNPAVVDGLPVWTSTDDTVLTVVPAADGMSAVVSAVGPDGTATITVTADADMGAGSMPVSGSLDIEVVSGQAARLSVTPGDPANHVIVPTPVTTP